MEGSSETVFNAFSLANDFLTLGRKMVDFSRQKAEEHLPNLISSASIAVERSKDELLPHMMKGLGVVLDNIKQHFVPLVIKAGKNGVEFVRKHPLLCGSLLLLVMLYYLPGLKLLLKMMQRGSVKMMKAPGKGGCLMARAAFENDPRGYFIALRGK